MWRLDSPLGRDFGRPSDGAMKGVGGLGVFTPVLVLTRVTPLCDCCRDVRVYVSVLSVLLVQFVYRVLELSSLPCLSDVDTCV